MTARRRAWALVAAAVTTVLVAGCGEDDCDTDACDEEIFHIDGEAVLDTLRRWLIVAVAMLALAVVGHWVLRWIRHRWLPEDTDW